MTFEDFAATELAPLLRFATVLTNDRGLAEDLCQDVLVKARSHWNRIAAMELPQAYVRRMIVNEYLSWRRKWARVVPRAEITFADAHPDHAGAIAEHQSVLEMVGVLPAQQRTALVLRFFEDLPDHEIARIMGCRETTVRGYIHRALQTLRVEHGPEQGDGFAPARTSRSREGLT